MSDSFSELSAEELRAEQKEIERNVLNTKAELEQRRQEVYDCKRQLKTAEVLEKEYQQEIEILRKREGEGVLKTLQALDAELAAQKQNANEQIECLEATLSSKNEETRELQSEKQTLLEGASNKRSSVSETLKEENSELTFKIDSYKKQNDQTSQTLDCFENENVSLQTQLAALKSEIDGLNENISLKKRELSEANDSLNALQEDMVVLKNNMESSRGKPLAKDAKGNSLFAEVDDRRVELGRRVQNMKAKCVEVEKEHVDLTKDFLVLRVKNIEMIRCWEADLLKEREIDEVLCSARCRIKELNVTIADHQKELIEKQALLISDADFIFWENRFKDKCKELEELRQELISESLKVIEIAEVLHEVRGDMRKLRLEKFRLQQELGKLKDETQQASVQNFITNTLSALDDTKWVIETNRENIDFSRLEKRCRNESLCKTTNRDDDIENNGRNVTEQTKNTNEKRNWNVKEINENPSRKVTFAEETVFADKTNKIPLRKGLKIIKSNPIFIPCPKK